MTFISKKGWAQAQKKRWKKMRQSPSKALKKRKIALVAIEVRTEDFT